MNNDCTLSIQQKYKPVKINQIVGNSKSINYIENWLNENKLECSEELGDFIKAFDMNLSIRIYKTAGCKDKLM